MNTPGKWMCAINSMKRLGMAAFLIISVSLAAKPPPQGEDWGAIQLGNTGVEPQALGVAKLYNVKSDVLTWHDSSELWNGYHGTLTIECQNLTPGARYSTPAGTFKADGRGRGKATGDVSFAIAWEISLWGDMMLVGDVIRPYLVEVVRLNSDGSGIPVLSGSFAPPE